jgi:hypothetical protein
MKSSDVNIDDVLLRVVGGCVSGYLFFYYKSYELLVWTLKDIPTSGVVEWVLLLSSSLLIGAFNLVIYFTFLITNKKLVTGSFTYVLALLVMVVSLFWSVGFYFGKIVFGGNTTPANLILLEVVGHFILQSLVVTHYIVGDVRKFLKSVVVVLILCAFVYIGSQILFRILVGF